MYYEETYPLCAVNNEIGYALESLQSAVKILEDSAPQDEDNAAYWRAFPEAAELHTKLAQMVSELTNAFADPKLAAQLKAQEKSYDEDSDYADR